MNLNYYPTAYSCPKGITGNSEQSFKGPQAIAINQSHRFSFVKALSLLVVMLLAAFISFSQGPCPTSNCTSGDMTITKVELVDAVTLGPVPNMCQPGQSSVPVKLKVTFDATAQTRYGFIIIGDISVGENFLTKIWQCYPQDFLQGEHVRILDQVINWPCGSTITLSNVYTAWRHQAPSTAICQYLNSDGTINNCSLLDPKCRYYGEQSFTIAMPLIANFTYGGTCGQMDLYQPITFTNASTGGASPYTTAWEVRDANTNTVLATSLNNPYTYTPASNSSLSVKLTVTDASSPQQSDSETKLITVTSCCEPTTVSSHPANQTKCQGTSASFSVNYSGGFPTPTIVWQVSTNSGGSWTNLTNNATYSGVSTTTLTVANVTTAMSGYLYRADLKSGACTSVQSNAASLTVDQTSVGGSVTPAQTICTGSLPNSSFILSGNTGTVVKWQKSTSSDFTFGVTDIVNTTTTLTPAEVGALTQDTWIRAVVKNGECSPVNSATVKVTVNVASVGGSVASSQTICYNTQLNSNLLLSSNTGTVVKWQKSTSSDFTSGVTDIANATTTLTPALVGALTQDTWIRAEVKNGECPSTFSTSVKITVNSLSVGGSVAATQTICSGNSLNSSLNLSGNTGSVVMWQKSTSSDFTSGVTNITNTSTTLTAAQAGTMTQNTWFRAVVKSGVCSQANSNAVMITVQQPISGNTIQASQVICSGNTPALLTGSTPTGGNGTPTYQWQSRTAGNNWSNIQGATNKDYAPGAIFETTEFRRIATAGNACSSNTSNIVTISISPESQIFPISGSNFCITAPNTGIVKLMGSYPGVSYQLKQITINGDIDIQTVQTGNGSTLTWSNLEAGTYYVYGTGLSPTFCTSRTANVVVREFNCSVFYTLTQGYYGGKGKSCIANNPVNTIRILLGTTEMIIGTTNSVIIPPSMESAMQINKVLPGGSTASALPAGNCIITNDACFKAPEYLTQNGRINNNLFSQTLTLSLNVRFNNGELLLFPVRSGYLTTQKMKGCMPDAIPVENCENNTISSIRMNQNVVDYLGGSATVADLLQLANDVLGGTKVPGVDGVPSFGDITSAVDCINKSFDEGRRFLNYYDTAQTCEMIFPPPALPALTIPSLTMRTEGTQLEVKAFPNPFQGTVNFVIDSKKSGQGSLEIFTMSGQKVKTVYQGYITAGIQRYTLNLPAQQRSHLFYILRVGGEKVTGKLLHAGSN